MTDLIEYLALLAVAARRFAEEVDHTRPWWPDSAPPGSPVYVGWLLIGRKCPLVNR